MFAAELWGVLAQGAAEGGETSLIDWPTVGIQVGNFLLLVILLRVFLYKRVLKAIDQRERKIAAHFEAAEEKEQDAIRKNEGLDADRKDLESKRDSMLADAKADAEKTRKDLSEQARADIDGQLERWRADLEREKDAFLDDIERRSGEEVCAVAKNALAELADVELERMMAGVLLRRIDEMPADARGEFARVVKESGEPITVATSWELPEEERERLSAAVGERLLSDVSVRFETAPEITCGIELRAAGREISWTVDGYITGIRDELAAAIDDRVGRRKPGENR